MKYWIGVVSKEHAKRGEALGIAQIGHGKRSGLARMHEGDWFVYYCPYETLGSKEPVQAFATLGQIADENIWQADEGSFQPFRRKVNYQTVHDAPIRPLLDILELTAGKRNWGYAFRYGLVEISEADFKIIANAMGVDLL